MTSQGRGIERICDMLIREGQVRLQAFLEGRGAEHLDNPIDGRGQPAQGSQPIASMASQIGTFPCPGGAPDQQQHSTVTATRSAYV